MMFIFDGAWLVGGRFGSSATADAAARTDMAGAHFNDANLEGTDFRYSLLDRADLRGADLTDADFTGASMEQVKVDNKTRFCRTIWTDGKERSDACPNGETGRTAELSECVKGKIWRDFQGVRTAAPTPPALPTEVERSYPIDETYDDHPSPFSESTRTYTIRKDAAPNTVIVDAHVVKNSDTRVSDLNVSIAPDRRSVVLTFKLTSGPGVDRYRGWLHGQLVLKMTPSQ